MFVLLLPGLYSAQPHPSPHSGLPAKEKVEYNCKEKKQRILFTAFYSGHMADGGTVLVYSEPEARWQQHLTGSVANIVLEYACSFRPQLPQTIPDIIFS
jgi:hypothetical protein